jgi:hypothetical protein
VVCGSSSQINDQPIIGKDQEKSLRILGMPIPILGGIREPRMELFRSAQAVIQMFSSEHSPPAARRLAKALNQLT